DLPSRRAGAAPARDRRLGAAWERLMAAAGCWRVLGDATTGGFVGPVRQTEEKSGEGASARPSGRATRSIPGADGTRAQCGTHERQAPAQAQAARDRRRRPWLILLPGRRLLVLGRSRREIC